MPIRKKLYPCQMKFPGLLGSDSIQIQEKDESGTQESRKKKTLLNDRKTSA
jgi:hypothetical protein